MVTGTLQGVKPEAPVTKYIRWDNRLRRALISLDTDAVEQVLVHFPVESKYPIAPVTAPFISVERIHEVLGSEVFLRHLAKGEFCAAVGIIYSVRKDEAKELLSPEQWEEDAGMMFCLDDSYYDREDLADAYLHKRVVFPEAGGVVFGQPLIRIRPLEKDQYMPPLRNRVLLMLRIAAVRLRK